MNEANNKISKDGEIDTAKTDLRYDFRKGFIDSQEPNTGQYFKGSKPRNTNPAGSITRVDGVAAYSPQASLYKGVSTHSKFRPQEGIDPRSGKMPRGPYHSEPPRYQTPRDKFGFEPQGPYKKEGKTPRVSPLPSNIEDSTTSPEAIHTTYRDLKSKLYTGMGSRTNKYVLELDIPVSGEDQPWTDTNAPRKGGTPGIRTLNILCQSTSFPQRQQHTASLWRFGRKYNLRGETNYGDTWQLEFVDDSAMSVRRALDRWFIDIDDSSLQGEGLDGLYRQPIDKLKNRNIPNREQGAKLDWVGASRSHATGFGKEYATSIPEYQTDIRVFQLDQVGNKTLGYLIQNAFISEISQVEYGDAKENELTRFSITITFSEFLPLSPDNDTLYQKMLN